MKKTAKYSEAIVLCFAIVGALLRYWTLCVGADSNDLYPANHGGWIGYLAVSAFMLVLTWLLSRNECAESTRVGVLSRATQMFAALGLCFYAVRQWSATGENDTLSFIVCLLTSAVGVFAAAALVPLRDPIFGRKQGGAMAYILTCIYFVLLLFGINLRFGAETEFVRFLPQAVAAAAAAFACYRFWGRKVGMDDARKRNFWRLLGAYLCIAAAPGAHWMFAAVGLWLLTGPYHGNACVEPSEETENAPDESTETEQC